MRYIEGTKTTGMGNRTRPIGYDIMASFLPERPAVSPDTSSAGVPEPCHPEPCRPAPQPLSPATTRASDPLTPVAVDAAGEEHAVEADAAVVEGLAASDVKPAKRQKIRPLSWSDDVSNLISNFQKEIRENSLQAREENRQMKDMLFGFMEESLANQRRLCEEERRRTDLLEKLLEEFKKDK